MFFLSFIPQFIQVENGNIFLQFLVLGLISNLLNFAADFVVVAFAGPIFRQGQRVASGCTLIGLGAYVAVADQK